MRRNDLIFYNKKPIKNQAHNSYAPFSIRNKIPVLSRPKSALVSFIKADVPKISKEKSTPRSHNLADIKPWSKPTSPFSSRPVSSNTIRGKNKFKSSDVTGPSSDVPKSSSEFLAGLQSSYPMNKYEQRSSNNDPSSVIQDYIASNKSKVFATEIPYFAHENFPAGKIKHSNAKKSLNSPKPDLPMRKITKKRSLPLKPSYFHLKRWYHPIKCKVNFTPRYAETLKRVFSFFL
jgi:hypothetical protein